MSGEQTCDCVIGCMLTRDERRRKRIACRYRNGKVQPPPGMTDAEWDAYLAECRESAVADAVRAERERVAEALLALGREWHKPLPDGLTFPSAKAAADFIRALPPADGNTEEEG